MSRKADEAEPSQTELLLHPADLGRIRFALSGSGHHMTITVTAESPETLRLLQSHAEALRGELAREGLGQAALSFAGPGPGDSGSQTPRSPFAAAAPLDTEPADPDPATLTTGRPLPGNSGLDLRL